MKKIFRWFKIFWAFTYIVLVTGFIAVLGFMTWVTMMNEGTTNPVNYLSLGIGLASLPGAFVQLINMLVINQKKEFIQTSPCPKCKHNVDIRLTEV